MPVEIAAVGEDDARTLDFVISSDAVMRNGDRINVDGWKLDNYRKNPVMLWAHDDNVLPIARASNTRIEGRRLITRAEFVSAELSPFADKVYRYYKDGFLNTVSAGWMPLKWSFVDTAERSGIDFLEQELLEFSAVTVPNNAEALVQHMVERDLNAAFDGLSTLEKPEAPPSLAIERERLAMLRLSI